MYGTCVALIECRDYAKQAAIFLLVKKHINNFASPVFAMCACLRCLKFDLMTVYTIIAFRTVWVQLSPNEYGGKLSTDDSGTMLESQRIFVLNVSIMSQ